MNTDFVNLTTENLVNEHLCCIIRSKKPHQGIDAKRQWLSDRLKDGHVFRKLNARATVFIEYAPLETAWVPIIGDNYYYLYCLWVSGSHKGKGYGKSLMEYCLADAKERGKSGICMLGAKKQKSWLSDQSFAKRFGFEVVDTTDNGYELLALSFDGTTPKFAQNVKNQVIENKELTIYYDMQCPYVYQNIEMIKQYCEMNDVPVSLIQMEILKFAQEKYSNGETTLQMLDDYIETDALYLLDEPEVSLSPANQTLLAEKINEMSRFLGCQFIISTHSPFMLATLYAKIYNLDSRELEVVNWADLENVRYFYDFFQRHKNKFK